SFRGVSKSFALQAGREIRIMVESEKISDEEAVWLSKDIARRIENELEYPGQIKVTVIRETRATDYAKGCGGLGIRAWRGIGTANWRTGPWERFTGGRGLASGDRGDGRRLLRTRPDRAD